MTALAAREDFIVVYPDGIERSWHDRREHGPAADQNVDDVAYIRALIDRFVADHSADPSRVYVDGVSNGGMMSFRLACELSDKIAAVAVVIGLMPENGAMEFPRHAADPRGRRRVQHAELTLQECDQGEVTRASHAVTSPASLFARASRA